ncbi:MAG: hypothetical protein LUH13_00975, partial [Oscillospiraceae bacterium]|nr:hypothetical protein [Oscillospiraceae bacterium]
AWERAASKTSCSKSVCTHTRKSTYIARAAKKRHMAGSTGILCRVSTEAAGACIVCQMRRNCDHSPYNLIIWRIVAPDLQKSQAIFCTILLVKLHKVESGHVTAG